MSHTANVIADNVQRVQQKIAEAAQVSGRSSDEITLVAVTKYVDATMTQLVAEAGCKVLGESRPQALWAKAQELTESQTQHGFRWHMIGHLQRNKVARTLPIVSLLHSVDSKRLLHEVNKSASAADLTAEVLLEVNISGDASKHGWAPAEMPDVLASIDELSSLRVRGLMAMAGLQTDEQGARREFAAMADLKRALEPNCPDNCEMRELSMGMSRDFVAAIEEGATMVRIGSTLFEGLS